MIRRKNPTCWQHIVIVTVIGIGLLVSSTFALAEDALHPAIFPPDSNPFGQSYKQWSAEWWQFVLSIPLSENPIFDETGEKCVVGQHGPVWFLAGTFSGTATRECSIPEGKAIFFPVLNNTIFNTPNVCGQGPENESAAALRARIAPFSDNVTTLSLSVDGERVPGLRKDFRFQSKPFEVSLPEDNIANPPCVEAGLGKVPAGIYSPAVSDGFYVMLKPLPVGEHTIHIRAESSGFSLEVRYNLTIVPVELEERG